jgi:uncharacterized protein
MIMEIEYDTDKNTRNIALRGLSFELVKLAKHDTLILDMDTRYSYGEMRFNVICNIEGLIYTVIYTKRFGKYRIISLRRANKRERDDYDNQARPISH